MAGLLQRRNSMPTLARQANTGLLIVLPIRQIGVHVPSRGVARRFTVALIFYTLFGLSFRVALLFVGIVRCPNLPLVSATAGKSRHQHERKKLKHVVPLDILRLEIGTWNLRKLTHKLIEA